MITSAREQAELSVAWFDKKNPELVLNSHSRSRLMAAAKAIDELVNGNVSLEDVEVDVDHDTLAVKITFDIGYFEEDSDGSRFIEALTNCDRMEIHRGIQSAITLTFDNVWNCKSK